MTFWLLCVFPFPFWLACKSDKVGASQHKSMQVFAIWAHSIWGLSTVCAMQGWLAGCLVSFIFPFFSATLEYMSHPATEHWLSLMYVSLIFHSDMTKLKCLFHSVCTDDDDSPFDVFTHIHPSSLFLSTVNFLRISGDAVKPRKMADFDTN